MKTLTLEYLKTYNACEEWINLFKASGLEGFPLKDLHKVEGDFKGFVSWIKEIEDCQYEYNDRGLMTKTVDPSGDVWLWEYNDQGLKTKSVTPSGDVWLYEYNDQGLITKKVDPDGNVWLYEYNDQGLKTKSVTPSGRVWLYEYNDQGLMTKRVTPFSGVTTWGYTFKNGQLTGITENKIPILTIPLFKEEPNKWTPKVGEECDWRLDGELGEWNRLVIEYKTEEVILGRCPDHPFNYEMFHLMGPQELKSLEFRKPLKTDREKFVDEVVGLGVGMFYAEKMYASGKFKLVEEE